MEHLRNALNLITNVLRHHKKKLATFFISFAVFFLLIFPYDDLSDLVSLQVAKMTNNQLYLQFDELSFNLLPAPGVYLEDVTVDASSLPKSLNMARVGVYPSISSLLQFKKGFSAKAQELFSGDLSLTISQGKKLDNDSHMQKANVDFENFNLKPLNDFAKLPMNLQGLGQLATVIEFDPSFIQQPEGELEINLRNVKLPATNIMTPFGELPLPELNFKEVYLKGRIVNSEFIIEQAQVGRNNDPIYLLSKGSLGVKIIRRGGRVQPVFTSYNFKVDLNVNQKDTGSLGLFLNFIDKYKSPNGRGGRYLFQASALRFGAPPKLSAIRKL